METLRAAAAVPDALSELLARLRWSVTSTGVATLGLGDRIRFAPADGAPDAVGPGAGDIAFHQVVAGSARIERTGETVTVAAGDFVLLPRGGSHAVTALEPLELFSGTMHLDPGPSALAGRLPDVLVACRFVVREPLVWSLLAGMRAERESGRPGSASVVTALGNAVAAAAIRSWIEYRCAGPGSAAGSAAGSASASGTTADGGPATASEWLVALRDPHIAPAIDAIHAEPGARWTVAGLARVAQTSRSNFAEQFKQTVGVPPLSYLARVRMERAMELLGREGLSVGATAAALGYCSDVGFSRAFRRFTGTSPSAWRRLGAGTAETASAPVLAGALVSAAAAS